MSHFRLHTRTNGKDRLKYVIAGIACILAVGAAGYALHSIGTARAKSRETVELHTGEELEQYLLDSESEDYNLNGSYRLEEDLERDGCTSQSETTWSRSPGNSMETAM